MEEDRDAAHLTKVEPIDWEVIELPDGSILHRNLLNPEKTFRDGRED